MYQVYMYIRVCIPNKDLGVHVTFLGNEISNIFLFSFPGKSYVFWELCNVYNSFLGYILRERIIKIKLLFFHHQFTIHIELRTAGPQWWPRGDNVGNHDNDDHRDIVDNSLVLMMSNFGHISTHALKAAPNWLLRTASAHLFCIF